VLNYHIHNLINIFKSKNNVPSLQISQPKFRRWWVKAGIFHFLITPIIEDYTDRPTTLSINNPKNNMVGKLGIFTTPFSSP